MKKKLNIFSNFKIVNFLTSFFSQYELIFLRLDAIQFKSHNANPNIIIINNNDDSNLISLDNLDENFLIMSSLKNNKFKSSNNIKILNTPLTINHIKNTIENFVENSKFQFHDISINNEKLINLKNKSFCYLTKIEVEILTYLIREKKTTKSFIRENILKIKSNIETNSLESHLTRIRKKLNKVNTKVKIQTKSDSLLILF